MQQYMEGLDAPACDISLSYDNGYLLLGSITPNFPLFSWLIKTDINGAVLWQKIIGGGVHTTTNIRKVDQNLSGEIFLCGSVKSEDDSNPVVIKLNVCGEKIWCQEISTTSEHDFFRDIVTTLDEGCAVLIYGAFLPLTTFKTGIMKFSSKGDLLWQKYYESSDTNIFGENLSNLIMTPDQGYLLTGYCYYIDPENPSYGWLHPYYIKADSFGNFEWETVVHKETGDVGGDAHMTLINPSQTCYYSCISHYYHSDTLATTRPALIKLDLQGNLTGVYDLVQANYDLGKIMTFDFFNDSILTGSAFWGNDVEPYESRVILFDTLGHVTDSVTVMYDYFLGFVKTTFDDKILIFKSDNTDGELDPTLIKLNMNLEQDTFYTWPFVYDSLCPYQIVSDTIVPDDCGVIVGIEEDGKNVGREDGKKRGLEIWPNPASGIVDFRWSMVDFRGDLSLMIYDVFGREVAEIKVPERQDQIQINVESYPPGVYIAILKNGCDLLGSGKFVVAR